MANVNVSGGGFDFDISSVGGKWAWRVVANNVVGAGQLYYVSDVRTPFGRLSDVDSPIPADVITAMSDSLSQFRQQLAPLLQLVGPSSLSVTVTEGDPSTDSGIVTFMNAGAFGSFMNVTATPGTPWMSVSPGFTSGIGKNQTAQVGTFVTPSLMLATSSPYVGNMNLQDNRVPSTVVSVPLTVTVLPRPTISLDVSSVTLTFDVLTQIPGSAQAVVVTNSGPATSLLNYVVSKAQNISPWLVFNPQGDGPIPSGGTSSVTFSILTSSVPRIAGTYTETVKISSQNASNTPVLVSVSLVVT